MTVLKEKEEELRSVMGIFKQKIIAVVFLSLLCVYGFSVFSPVNRSILWIILYAFTASFMYHGLLVKTNKRISISAILLGTAFAAFTAVGYELEREGALAIYKEFLLQFLGLAVFFSLTLRALFSYLIEFDKRDTFPMKKATIATLKTGLLFLVCWLPYFIIFYPGTMSSDALGEIRQQLGMSPLSNHHPIIHQLLIKLCLVISKESVENATAIYSLFQMAFLAFAFAACITFIRKKGASRGAILMAVVFFAFFPVNPMFAIMMEKGSLFAGVTVCLMLLLLEETEDRGKEKKLGRIVALIGVSFLFCTVRNNGFYAFIFGFLCYIIANIYNWKRLLCIYFSVLVLVFGYQNVLFDVAGVAKSASGESLSIPLQQIARVVYDDPEIVYSQDFEVLGELFNDSDRIGEMYEPTSSDPIKRPSVFKSEVFDANPSKYIKEWIKLGLSHPKQYFEAFIMENYGYWFTDNSHYTVSYSIFTPNDFSLQNNTRFEALREQVTDAISKMQYSSLFSILFSIGFSCWILLVTAVALCLRKDNRIASPLLIIAGLWLTTIAGPMYCEYRYLYALVVCIPLFLPLVFRKKNE